MNPVRVARIGSAVLGAVYAWWGVWALLFPHHFFETFPGLGRRWTAAYPPYNEHLVNDVGAIFLTMAYLGIAGAIVRNSGVRAVAFVAIALFGGLHLAFHVGHHGELAGGDLIASLLALAGGVVVPLLLLLIERRAGRAPSQTQVPGGANGAQPS
jgi:hypothetical protein